jgi:hypothetical protein
MKYTLREWQKSDKNINDLIVQASMEDGSDSWVEHSIGMSWQFVHIYKQWKDACKNKQRDKLILVSISPNTDQLRRRNHSVNRLKILNTIPFNNNILNLVEYFLTIPTYKFVLSPEGNGIDCHRHYEALLSGCIPIIEDNPLTRKKYDGLPILWTHDYSEITESYLEEQYNNMLDKEYDWSSLFLSSYSNKMQELIKRRGNYWTKRVTNKEWYSLIEQETMEDNMITDDIFNIYNNHNVVWITVINSGYVDFLRNFIKLNESRGIDFPLLVFALDENAYNETQKLEIPCVKMYCKLKTECLRFGSLDYKRVTLKKIDAIRICLNKFKIPVGYIDTDIALFKNPIPYIEEKMKNNPEINIWSQCDEGICMQECNVANCNVICSGFIVIKPNVKHILKYTEEDVHQPHIRGDQDVIRINIIKHNISYRILERSIITNGAYVGFPNNKLPIPSTSILLHFNWIAGGKEKKEMMQHYNCWII